MKLIELTLAEKPASYSEKFCFNPYNIEAIVEEFHDDGSFKVTYLKSIGNEDAVPCLETAIEIKYLIKDI